MHAVVSAAWSAEYPLEDSVLMNTPADAPSCPCCRRASLSTLYRQKDIPTTSNLLMPTRGDALRWPRANLTLKLCGDCGFIFNSDFDPSTQQHTARYEATQGHSPTFSAFARQLAERWTRQHQLTGKQLLEIGCLHGDFIAELCDVAQTTGIGIDPELAVERTPQRARGQVEYIADFYGPKYAHLPADFICCRHTLEHIATPLQFLRSIRAAIGNRTTAVGFEVPDTRRVLEEGAFWDIYYEHCSYFTAESLNQLFVHAGFQVTQASLEYDGQYLIVDAVPAQQCDAAPHPIAPAPALSSDALHTTLARWRAFDVTQRVAIWGSGSKAVGFLTTLGLSHESVPFVVDINPHKHGTFLPGTGQQIIAPADLAAFQPAVVVAMNPIYRDEIQQHLTHLGIGAELLTL